MSSPDALYTQILEYTQIYNVSRLHDDKWWLTVITVSARWFRPVRDIRWLNCESRSLGSSYPCQWIFYPSASTLIQCIYFKVYDYCLTFAQEVEAIWKREICIISLVFFVSRYLVFFDGAFVLLSTQTSLMSYHKVISAYLVRFLPNPSPSLCEPLLTAWGCE